MADNLSIRFADGASGARVSGLLQELRAVAAEELLPEVSDKAVDGLKFNACLPPSLARRVLQMRMTDFPAARRVLEEPVVVVMNEA